MEIILIAIVFCLLGVFISKGIIILERKQMSKTQMHRVKNYERELERLECELVESRFVWYDKKEEGIEIYICKECESLVEELRGSFKARREHKCHTRV